MIDSGRSLPGADRAWTILALIQASTEFLRAKSVDSPRLAAELLLSHVLGCRRIDLYTRFDQPVSDEARAQLRELVRRRAQHIPTQYLIGKCEFMSLEFSLNQNVLIPRPETELLVEAAIRAAQPMDRPVIADLGTGCGNIAVSLALKLPDAQIFACDLSEAALEVARANAAKHNIAHRITFLQGDWFEPLKRLGCVLEMVVSNPPYVADAEFESLQPEVRDHEPRLALAGGPDGLDSYRRIAEDAPRFLKQGGCLLLEMPDGKSEQIRSIVERHGCMEVLEIIKDYNRIERVLTARKIAADSLESRGTPPVAQLAG